MAGASGHCYSTAFCTINTTVISPTAFVVILVIFFVVRMSLICMVYRISKWRVEQLFCFYFSFIHMKVAKLKIMLVVATGNSLLAAFTDIPFLG